MKTTKEVLAHVEQERINQIVKHQEDQALTEIIKTYTNEGELVLDNCMGSGSTAVACINTDRNFIGYELDKGYFDIACKRIDEHKNKG